MAALLSLPSRARCPAALPSSLTKKASPPPFSCPSFLSRIPICRKRHLSVRCLQKSHADHKVLGGFQGWLRDKGVSFPSVKPGFVPEGLDLVAQKDIDRNEMVVEVPKRTWIKLDTVAVSVIGPVCAGSKPWIRMALFLLREMALGEESDWSPYLRILPTQMDSTIYWLEEELAKLEAEPAKTMMKNVLGKGVSIPSMADLICTSRTTRQKISPTKSTVVKSRWEGSITRRAIMTTMLIVETCLASRQALAEEWGTHSLILERFFLPGLSPENSAARIRQTAQGMHGLRHMLDTMSWRYVIFYVRQKASYLSSDLKNALATLPENRRQTYIRTANELVDNMSELDYYVRTPKVYESYLFYEKTLKSLDDLVALLA